MTGLPQDLYNRCRTILLKSNAFDSDTALRSLFITQELLPFRGDLPGGRSNVARVNALLEHLLGKKTIAGDPVLPIFLRLLGDQYQGQWLYKELEAMAQDLEGHSQKAEDLLPPPPPEKGHFDVCIVCALPEEARAVREVVTQLSEVEFQNNFIEKDKSRYAYWHTTIANVNAEPLSLLVSWPPRYGSVEMNNLLKALLPTCKPRFVAMTGICAADREKVALGDLIVAEKTFSYGEGKFKLEDGNPVLLHDVRTAEPQPNLLQFVKGFDAWRAYVQQTDQVEQLLRPPSRRQQREWLLQALLAAEDHAFESLDEALVEQHAPEWRRILLDLQQGAEPYLTADRKLQDPGRVRELRYRPEGFPYVDPSAPRLYIKTMASVQAVRADNPFSDIQKPVRTAIAIDMEAHAFYQAAAKAHALVVKGVSDYADQEKDDSYHAYAAAASAAYILALIRHYVTDARLPRVPKLH